MHIVWNSTFPWIHFVRDIRETSSTTNPIVRLVASPVIVKETAAPPIIVPSAPVDLPKGDLVTKPIRLDMLDVMNFNKPGFCLSGSYDIVLKDPTMVLHIKNPNGYPVDGRFYDEHFIYDQNTEVNWVDPGAIKLHVGNGGRGNRICPRYVMSDAFPFTLSEADSPVLYIKDGQYDFRPMTSGPTSYTWHKPEFKDWGGDVKNVLTYPVDYFWSGIKNREQYFFAPPFGLVKWNHGNLVAASYNLDNDPPANTKLQTLADRKVPAFGYKLPFLSLTAFTRGTY